ncbi:MAG: HlyD family efflux transporter periplasmic adaptor subunit, partial [Zetaproteobacteria bacterium]|nr:HlyD family efflux transporter periplasmic adaptor subunit [Flavobacteriales bacterium]
VSPVSPVIRLVNLDDVYVEADVSENYIGKIKKGDEAKVYFESLDKTFETKIAQVADFIDPNNRSFKVKIFINNQDQSLKPNLIATIKINDFTVNSAITLPSSIVQEDQKGNNFVYTLQQENKAYKVVKTLVVKGLSYNDYTYIQSGLTLNASVIEKGARGIKDGQIVSVLNQ